MVVLLVLVNVSATFITIRPQKQGLLHQVDSLVSSEVYVL